MLKSKSKSRKLQVEQLEDRLCPTVLFWNPGGADHNWSTASNWHIVNDNGMASLSAPGSSDTATFDNAKNCTLDVSPTVANLNINAFNTGTISINGKNLNTNAFTFAGGIIDFASSGGSVNLFSSTTDSWTGSAGFHSTNGSGTVSLQSNQLNVTGAATKDMQCTLSIGLISGTNANMEIKADTTIALGNTGCITINNTGLLLFSNSGTTTISCNHGTNSLSLLNSGTFKVDSGSSTVIVVDVPIGNSGILQLNHSCILDVHNYYNTSSAALTQSGSNSFFYANSGCSLLVDAGGYSQTAGQMYVYTSGTDNIFWVGGNMSFTGGKLYMNPDDATFNSSLDASGNGSNTITFGSSFDIYTHVGKGTGKTFDTIKADIIVLAGNLHVKNNGTFNQNDFIECIFANNANGMSGSFAHLYDTWTGTNALAFNQSIVNGKTFRLTKT